MRKFNVTVNGKSYVVDVEEVGSDGQVTPVISTVAAAPVPVAKPVAGDGTPVKAPMPGLILGLAHKDGDVVKKNEKVVVLEAMKWKTTSTRLRTELLLTLSKKATTLIRAQSLRI